MKVGKYRFKWNDHWRLAGKHSEFSPSSPSWLNYDISKLLKVHENREKKELGTRLHAYASEAIKLRRKQSTAKDTVAIFINDCIKMGMASEKTLYYSDYFFGTTDAIKIESGKLWIFDLKTGEHKADFRQLDIYCALFCLEYGYDPRDLEIEERIYQFNTFSTNYPDRDYICNIMDHIVEFDASLQDYDAVDHDLYF